MTFTNKISRCICEVKGVEFGDKDFYSSLCRSSFTSRFTAEYEGVGMSISLYNPETMMGRWKRGGLSTGVEGQLLLQVDEFKYIEGLVCNRGKEEAGD